MPENDALAAALRWVEELLVGTIGTAVAVLAVAAIGGLALSGRIDARRALVTLIGCFVVFGSGSIASALIGNVDPSAASVEPLPPPTLKRPSNERPPGYDPYAFATTPTNP